MARVSQWARLRAAEARLPAPDPNPIVGILHRYVSPAGYAEGLITGLSYHVCQSYEHPLDGQSIDFGEPGIPLDDVPSPWRELLDLHR